MVLNAAIDLAIGLVPLLGDLVDFGWKANVRNLALLERHARPGAAPRADDWVFVIGVLLLLVVIAVMPLLFAAWLLSRFQLV